MVSFNNNNNNNNCNNPVYIVQGFQSAGKGVVVHAFCHGYFTVLYVLVSCIGLIIIMMIINTDIMCWLCSGAGLAVSRSVSVSLWIDSVCIP